MVGSAWVSETEQKRKLAILDLTTVCQESYYLFVVLKGLSYEIDFENVDENGQILA